MGTTLARATLAKGTLVVLSIIFASLIPANIGSAIDPETATGMWLFNEGNGDVAKDSSGNSNDGEIFAGPEWVGEGKFGSMALEFDGEDDHLRTSFQAIEAQEGTIVAWTKTSKDTGNQYIVYTSAGSGNGFGGETEFHMGFIDKVVSFYFTAVAGAVEINIGTVNKDEWSHIAVTWKVGDKARLYANGELLGERDCPEPNAAVWVDYVYIGRPSANERFFGGTIDEVGIFNVAFEKEDIEKIMNEGLEKASAVSPADKLATTWGQVKYE